MIEMKKGSYFQIYFWSNMNFEVCLKGFLCSVKDMTFKWRMYYSKTWVMPWTQDHDTLNTHGTSQLPLRLPKYFLKGATHDICIMIFYSRAPMQCIDRNGNNPLNVILKIIIVIHVNTISEVPTLNSNYTKKIKQIIMCLNCIEHAQHSLRCLNSI